MPMASDIVSRDNRLVVMPYNSKWRTTRKVIHQVPLPLPPLIAESDDCQSGTIRTYN